MSYRVKEIRKEKKITQEELVRKSGISRQTISAIENGKVKFINSRTLLALSAALEVPVDDIFFPEVV